MVHCNKPRVLTSNTRTMLTTLPSRASHSNTSRLIAIQVEWIDKKQQQNFTSGTTFEAPPFQFYQLHTGRHMHHASCRHAHAQPECVCEVNHRMSSSSNPCKTLAGGNTAEKSQQAYILKVSPHFQHYLLLARSFYFFMGNLLTHMQCMTT